MHENAEGAEDAETRSESNQWFLCSSASSAISAFSENRVVEAYD